MSLLLLSVGRPRGQTALVAAFTSARLPSGKSTRNNDQQLSHSFSKMMISSAATGPFVPLQHHKFFWSNRRRSFSSLMMSAIDEDEAVETTKTIDSEWNLKGLKQEVNRLVLRSHKKIGKASTRVRKARELVDKLTADENATMEQLEACPNLDALELELTELQTRLRGLNQLNDLLAKEKAAILKPETAQLALDLGVDDQPPQRQPRGPKKQKGPRNKNPPKTRLPYRRFYTEDKTEIRVGKQAEDNDELSIRPEHRDGADWWMHASGCPGSHVVIRTHDANVAEEIVQDAAALAARQSKCSGQTIKVSMCRCRDVKKPMGAKAGLVQLTGQIRTVVVNMKQAEQRLERLDKTVVIN